MNVFQEGRFTWSVKTTRVPTVYITHDSHGTGRNWRRHGKEAVGRQGRPGRMRMLAATPGQSPGTTIQPWCQELYDIISHHTITMLSFAINKHLDQSIVPPQTLPMPALPPNLTGTGRGHFHLIDCWCVCVVGATACLHRRWESGSVANWSSQRGGCRTCETGQATQALLNTRAHSVPALFM